MKAMKRRLLSLLLAMAMVCTLVPTALAGTEGGGQVTNPTYVCTVSGSPTSVAVGSTVTLEASLTNNGATVTDNVTYAWSLPTGMEATGGTSGKTVTIKATGTPTTTVTGSVTCTATPNEGTGVTSTGTTVTFTYTAPVADKVVLSGTGVTGGTSNTYALTMTSDQTATVNAQLKDTASQDMAGAADLKGGTAGVCTGSINNNVITLNAGTVTVQSTATFTVTCGGKTATLNVTVNPAPQTITASLTSPTPSTIYHTGAGAGTTLTVNGDITGYALNWVISPAGAVTVTKGDSSASVLTGTYNITAASAVETARTVSIQAKLSKAGAADVLSNTITLTVNPYNTLLLSPTGGTPSTSSIVYLNNWTGNSDAEWADFAVSAVWQQGGATQPIGNNSLTYAWTLNGTPMTNINSYSNSFRLYSSTYGLKYGNQDNTLTCTVKLTSRNQQLATSSISWTIRTGYAANAFATATVSTSTSSYALGDVDDAGKSSIVSQLDSYFYNKSGYYGLAYVQFTGTTQNNTYGSLSARSNTNYYADRRSGTGSNTSYLADVLFYPGSSKGSVSFPVRVYYYTSNTLSTTNWVDGTIAFTVTEDATSGDITYTASIGDDVYFDMGDFEDLYYTKTSRGTLDRVTFTMPSGGYLYSDRSRLSASNATCYVSPRSNENDLGSVYFSPTGTTASRAGTVRVGFTAYGNRSNVSGTVAITYLNGAAKDITYSTVGGSVTLDHQDFIDAYKEVTGKTAPSNLTIQFQEVPSNGTLTYTGGSRDVDLTKSNVRSNKYSTKTTGSYRLNQLTYTGTRGTDTIEYIAYSGSAAQFTGKVVFNGTAAVPTDVVVTYGSIGGQAVMFSQNDFVRANSVMSNAVKVRFVTPTNGTLTMNGANAAGIDIASSLLGSVSYKPKAGFNGTDKIIFAAYDSRNQLAASGSVNITVVGNTGTSTTTPGGVTDVSQFKDVSSTAWYRNDLATLVSQGIITGKGEGKFDPLGTVTYGEALKMILEACGYTATLGTGSNWAINYKNLAVSNGWISSSIDLNAAISRNATAELAARVMGVAPATGGSPFADEANAYAVALYYTNPQIFVGDNTTGKLLFKNGSPLLRQEVCAVICRVRNYHTQHTSNTMPDGI